MLSAAARAQAALQPGALRPLAARLQRPGAGRRCIDGLARREIGEAQQQRGSSLVLQAAATEAEAVAAAAAEGGNGASPWFSIDMAVRDYEMDQYSVVNNAVYANYLQHVRHEFLLHVGISADTVARTGDALALSELNMRYIRPLRSGDRFRGVCRVSKATGVRLVFEQQIWLQPRDGSPEQLVLTAEAVVVTLDNQYKPKRISPALRERMLAGAAAGGAPVPLQELM